MSFSPRWRCQSFAGVVHADDHCSTASLEGRYAGSGHSRFTNPQLNLGDASATVALTDFDGRGNFATTSGVINANGTIFHYTASGTYEVSADCIDASLVVNPDCTVTWSGAGSGSSHFYGVAVMKHSRVTLHMVEVDPPPTDPNTGANLPGTTVEFTAVGTPRDEW